MQTRAFIAGLTGLNLSADERAFLRESSPWGVILFRRNISTPSQVIDLVSSFRDVIGWRAPVLIDQEGGRVQRLGPPHWPVYPPGAWYGALYNRNPKSGMAAAELAGRLMASDLEALGIDVNCLPVADVPVLGSDPVIGDRAYGTQPAKVAAIAGAMAHGLQSAGVVPVLKHLPGHGRASVDSHHRLPVVDVGGDTLDATDFAAFRPLVQIPMGMTAHVVFSALDPIAPATTSCTIVQQVIRTSIGFDGLLMSDDISMNALSGTIAERTRAAFAAGCDIVLHCNGDLDEMTAVAAESPFISGDSARRANAALAARSAQTEFDVVAGRKIFNELMAREATS